MNRIHLPRPMIFFVALCLIVIGTSLLILLKNHFASAEPSPSLSSTPVAVEDTTTKGTLECLPHKNTAGPTTLECAFGIKAASGDYYALDTTFFPSEIANLPTGRTLTVIGTILPPEATSPYNIRGVIRVKDLTPE